MQTRTGQRHIVDCWARSVPSVTQKGRNLSATRGAARASPAGELNANAGCYVIAGAARSIGIRHDCNNPESAQRPLRSFPIKTDALWPPKPKLLLIATLIARSRG